MIRKIKYLFLKVKDKTVSLSLVVCRNIKQFAVFSAKKVSDGTGKFVSFIGKYAFVFSVFSVIGIVMFFVRKVLAKQG
ncbi:hypothetical protein [Ruminococcus sp.]|uniref:hypothetical protein n=1 Tax=Ruminococcus sp. TaxID=41978 RepID=UPI003F06C8BB